MSNVLFLSLVHPDFLPPVYAMAGVLREEGYAVTIITFESTAPGSFDTGKGIEINVVGSHHGSAMERNRARKHFISSVDEYVNKYKPKAIFTFCDFSLIAAKTYFNTIPVYHNALEMTNASWMNFFRSPQGTIRTFKAISLLSKVYWVGTPSYERSAWLAGRYDLKKVPETVLNTPYVRSDYKFQQDKFSTLLPPAYKSKIRLLHTGGVNDTRSVIELLKGFDLSEEGTCLIITNITGNGYSQKVKELVNTLRRKDDVLLLGIVSREELLELQASCHIGVCLMKTEQGFDARMVAPNKVGEYFYSGLLVLGIDTPYFYPFTPYGVCNLVSDLNSDSIRTGIEQLLEKVKTTEYKKNIMKCLVEWYNMKYQMRGVLKLLKSI
jgi:hypothetical protein